MSPTKLQITGAVVRALSTRTPEREARLMGLIGHQVGVSIKNTGGVEGVARNRQAYDFSPERTRIIFEDLKRRKWRKKGVVLEGRGEEIIETAKRKLLGDETV